MNSNKIFDYERFNSIALFFCCLLLVGCDPEYALTGASILGPWRIEIPSGSGNELPTTGVIYFDTDRSGLGWGRWPGGSWKAWRVVGERPANEWVQIGSGNWRYEGQGGFWLKGDKAALFHDAEQNDKDWTEYRLGCDQNGDRVLRDATIILIMKQYRGDIGNIYERVTPSNIE